MNEMEIEEIQEYLPHRYPFLFVDRVIELELGKYIKAYKNVTTNEPFFPGHFPEKQVMPGVLILEAMAQASGILGFNTMDKKTQVYLKGKIDEIARGRTLVATIHDMRFIEDFDWIIVLESGSVVGQGKHEDLLETCPLYQEMWALEGKISSEKKYEVEAA